MRFLLFLFVFFFSIHSYFVFADEAPPPSCSSQGVNTFCYTEDCAQHEMMCLTQSPTNFYSLTGSYAHGETYICQYNCSCPEGTRINTVINNGNYSRECIPDETSSTGDDCPSGGIQAPDGSCPVCPGGQNPDGTCNDPTQCGEGEIKQGEINGTAVCAGTCADPNQYWGFVNGVEGCYGSPSCPSGGSYGYVNGVGGCYGTDSSSGSNTSSGTATSAGSNTSSGSGGGGGSAGSNTSSGSGSGTNTSSGGNGGGGGGGGSNNDIGAHYPVEVPCEDNFEKVGSHCVSAGQGDCITGYHELIVSRDPFLFICVANDTPPPEIPASSQPSASSQPNSSASNSQSNSSPPSSSGGGGGSGTTTSSGSGSGGGTGSGGEGSGQCDPSSPDYLSCISGSSSTEITDLSLASYNSDMQERLQFAQDKYTSTITNIKTEFQAEMTVNIGGGSAGLPSKNITLYGQTFEAGIAARADFFELIRWAFFAAASILSLYILLSR